MKINSNIYSMMNNKYRSYDNAIKIKDIPKTELTKKVRKALTKIAMDNSQVPVGEEFSYMVMSVVNELHSKHMSLMWGEFVYTLDVGSEGKFGNFYKINANCIKQWLFKYKSEQINKMAIKNAATHKEIKTNPMSPYMAAAVRLRMDNVHLREYSLKDVADSIKVLKTNTVVKIINYLDNGKTS